MRRALPWILGAVLVVGAGAVTAMTPAEEDVLAPFTLRGEAGETVSSRALVATVEDAVFADEVTVSDGSWSAEGNWLVVRITASAAQTEVDAAVQLATLVVGDRVFLASERPSAALRGTALRVGIDTVGVLAFELPPDVSTGTAELRLTTDFVTSELDDLIVVTIDLGDLDRSESVELTRSEVVPR
ncbi:hypothetical protein [Microbacterium sp. GCS4]|uniref:hypothetical protein n=1 Tax=Microbacterium sp. GCS4 TaxID=1692239 RepID=UPI0006805D4F|nr:hypothetical protein [Microbacterium sp. GCS4]KNY05960.1 hypothetical protein AKH00_09005 [Microbacterium sp. GCS4]